MPDTLLIVAQGLLRAAAAALLLAALSLIGYCIVPRAWQPRGLRLRVPFALSAGAIVTGWVAWVSAAIFGTVAAWIAAAALLLFSVRQARRWWRDSLRFSRLLTALLRRNPLLASVLCLLIALTIPQLLIPVVDSDGLRYHLAFPKLYLLTGEVNFYPWDVTGGFPHTAEMLYLIALPLGGEVAKFVHTGFFCGNLILLILLIHRGRRTRAAALLGAILFAAAPVATCPAAAAFIDHIALYHVGVALLILTRRGEVRSAGIAAGAAFATKITTAPALLALAAATIVLRRGRARTLALFLVPAAILFLPFAVRNAVHTGDPFYPVGRGLLGIPIEGVAESALQYATRYHEEIDGIVGIPWTLRDGVVADEVVGIQHLLGLFALLFAIRKPATRYALAVVFAYLAISLLFRPPVRYLLPLVFCLAAFEGWALARMRPLIASILALTVALPAMLFLTNIQLRRFAPFDFITGRASRRDYLSSIVPGYRATQVVNRLEPGGTVMALDFPSPYYFGRPWIVEGILHDPPLQQWLARGATAEELLRKLNELDVRLIVVTPGYGGGKSWSMLPVATTQRSSVQVRNLKQTLTQIYRDSEFDIYEIPQRGK